MFNIVLLFVTILMVVHSFNSKSINNKINFKVLTSFKIFNNVNNNEFISNFIPISNLSTLSIDKNYSSYSEPSLFITGFNENQLELLDDIILNITGKNMNTVILNENYRNKKVYELVNKSFILKNDHVLPDKEYSTSYPLVLFHALNEIEIRAIMKNLRLLLNNNNIVFAVVVKNSLDKTLCKLIDEIFEDNNFKKYI